MQEANTIVNFQVLLYWYYICRVVNTLAGAWGQKVHIGPHLSLNALIINNKVFFFYSMCYHALYFLIVRDTKMWLYGIHLFLPQAQQISQQPCNYKRTMKLFICKIQVHFQLNWHVDPFFGINYYPYKPNISSKYFILV